MDSGWRCSEVGGIGLVRAGWWVFDGVLGYLSFRPLSFVISKDILWDGFESLLNPMLPMREHPVLSYIAATVTLTSTNFHPSKEAPRRSCPVLEQMVSWNDIISILVRFNQESSLGLPRLYPNSRSPHMRPRAPPRHQTISALALALRFRTQLVQVSMIAFTTMDTGNERMKTSG